MDICFLGSQFSVFDNGYKLLEFGIGIKIREP